MGTCNRHVWMCTKRGTGSSYADVLWPFREQPCFVHTLWSLHCCLTPDDACYCRLC